MFVSVLCSFHWLFIFLFMSFLSSFIPFWCYFILLHFTSFDSCISLSFDVHFIALFMSLSSFSSLSAHFISGSLFWTTTMSETKSKKPKVHFTSSHVHFPIQQELFIKWSARLMGTACCSEVEPAPGSVAAKPQPVQPLPATMYQMEGVQSQGFGVTWFNVFVLKQTNG